MVHHIRRVCQIIFLALFIFLVAQGKTQGWMIVFLLGIILSKIWGRFYCGWLCPINTLMESSGKVLKSLGIKKRALPGFLKNPLWRTGILGIFIATFVFILVSGHKIPVLIILLALGVGISFIYPQLLWHRYLCPYGTILQLMGRHTLYSMKIDNDKCVSCQLCKKVCKAGAIDNHDDGSWVIDPGLCFQCLECSLACNKAGIHYGRVEK